MRLNHIAYWVKDRNKAAKFFCDTMFYKIDPDNPYGFDIKLKDNNSVKCFVLVPYERISNDLNQKEVNKSISLFHGLDNIQKKQNIDAFAIRCWPEMFTEYGCASCGPMAMMNENKISCACEADVLGSLSCNILNQLNLSLIHI